MSMNQARLLLSRKNDEQQEASRTKNTASPLTRDYKHETRAMHSRQRLQARRTVVSIRRIPVELRDGTAPKQTKTYVSIPTRSLLCVCLLLFHTCFMDDVLPYFVLLGASYYTFSLSNQMMEESMEMQKHVEKLYSQVLDWEQEHARILEQYYAQSQTLQPYNIHYGNEQTRRSPLSQGL